MSDATSRPRPWLRRMVARDPEEEGRASTPLELLFDLTFVVAVAEAAGELRHGLAQGHLGHALAGYARAGGLPPRRRRAAPQTTHFVDVSSESPIGPRACSFSVEMGSPLDTHPSTGICRSLPAQ